MKFMKILSVFIMIQILLLSCNKKEYKEFYSDGSLKRNYHKDNNKLDGSYMEYYENGGLKEVHMYKNGVNVDSSLYYYKNNPKQKIKQIRYWSDSTNFNVYYYKNGGNEMEGNALNRDVNFRIGNWRFWELNSSNDSIVEYKTINEKPYPNQFWIINKTGDTLRGNYFSVYFKDTIHLGDVARVRFFLIQPFYNYNSDIEIIIPRDDVMLNSDYSNLFEIERDTFLSLKNDGIPHPEIPKEVPINHIVEFGFKYDTSGKKKIRGVLIEYIYDYLDNVKYPDSLYKIERRLYFDKELYIRKKQID